MRAFQGSNELKSQYLGRLNHAKEMGNFKQRIFGKMEDNGWSGCAIGVLAHNGHGLIVDTLVKEMGIDKAIFSGIISTFDALPLPEAEDFIITLINAIPVGADTSLVSEVIKKRQGTMIASTLMNKDIADNFLHQRRSFAQFMIDQVRSLEAAPIQFPIFAQERELVAA